MNMRCFVALTLNIANFQFSAQTQRKPHWQSPELEQATVVWFPLSLALERPTDSVCTELTCNPWVGAKGQMGVRCFVAPCVAL